MTEYKRLTAHKITSFYDWERENLKPEQITEIYDRLAELEDKIEDGTLRFLPCKVGDTVWCLIAQGRLGTIYTTGEAIPRKVNKIILDGHKVEIYTERLNYHISGYDNGCNYYGYFNETVFLTKAEAEQKLRELKGEL